MKKVIEITELEWLQKREFYEGYCTYCGEFTHDMTESDAREYDCPVCDNNTVYGAEEALFEELITFIGE